MRRTACSACGSPDLEIFLDLGLSPIADAYTSASYEASPTHPLEVATCGKCRLVQLLEVVPADELFGTGYSFYSSASPPLSAYHRAYAQQVLERYPDQCQHGVVELGCNDGDLLRHFMHVPHVGVDPAEGPTSVARQRGLNVLTDAFGAGLADDMALRPGVIMANHVLAHVEDVSDFLAGMATLMDAESVAIIEVQYLPDLLVNNAFDLIYHEHRNFFSLTTLDAAARQHGLAVVNAELTDRQGGSLRATLRRTRPPVTRSSRASHIVASEQWLNDFSAYGGMQGRAERIRTRLIDLLDQAQSGGRDVGLYGAPAKATTLLNFCKLTATDLPFCWDSTPAKQGRYIPGTGIPILAPWGKSPRPATFLLAAWNYAQTIMHTNPGFRWIVPLPAPWLMP